MESPFQPAAPVAPRFDPERRAWTLSRYAEVYAALREPALHQATAQNQIASEAGHSDLYAQVQADMARMNSEQWRKKIEATATAAIRGVSSNHTVDLVRTVIQPWAVSMMVALGGADPALARRMSGIAGGLFFSSNPGTAKTPIDKFFSKCSAWRRRRADAALDKMLQQKQVVLSKPMFSGLTQTLPSFLAKAWLALLENPGQMARLSAEPGLMPGAVEELLRYAGIVHTLYRRATQDLTIGEARITRDDLVILKLASANFDPEKFDDPYRLDVARKITGHLGFGTGSHACVGAVLVRMALAATTPAFLAAEPIVERGQPVIWTGDSTVRWPLVLPGRFQHRS